MKILMTLMLVAISTIGIGQISIDKDDLPAVGETFTVLSLIDFQLDYESTGANYQWDFSSLSSTNTQVKAFNSMSGAPFLINFNFGPLAATNYRASYYAPFTGLPLDQLGGVLPITLENINQYTRVTDQRLTLIGYSAEINGQGVPMKSDTIETKYHFPLEYGDSYESKGYTSLNLDPILDAQWKQRRKRSTEVDGWGTITTAYGTFDVLRVKHIIEENDSITFSGTSFGMDIPLTVEYEWLAKDEKLPILKVVTNVIAGNEVVTSVEMKTNEVISVTSAGETAKFSFYPNPVVDELTMNMPSGNKMIKIYQVDGTLVFSKESDVVTEKINTSELKAGMYIVSLEKNGEVVKSNFVKK